MTDETRTPLSEGMEKKGGSNNPPQAPKQKIKPPPQKPKKD